MFPLVSVLFIPMMRAECLVTYCLQYRLTGDCLSDDQVRVLNFGRCVLMLEFCLLWSVGACIPSVCLNFSLTRSPIQVKEARRLRTIHIVRLEWLEDSLLSNSRRPLDTFKYEYEHRKIPKPRRTRRCERTNHNSSEDSDDGAARAVSRREKIQELKLKKQQSQSVGGISKTEKLEISGKILPCTELRVLACRDVFGN